MIEVFVLEAAVAVLLASALNKSLPTAWQKEHGGLAEGSWAGPSKEQQTAHMLPG